jgi:hypothetical protein
VRIALSVLYENLHSCRDPEDTFSRNLQRGSREGDAWYQHDFMLISWGDCPRTKKIIKNHFPPKGSNPLLLGPLTKILCPRKQYRTRTFATIGRCYCTRPQKSSIEFCARLLNYRQYNKRLRLVMGWSTTPSNWGRRFGIRRRRRMTYDRKTRERKKSCHTFLKF